MFDKDKLKDDLIKNRQFASSMPAKGFAFPFARVAQFDQGDYKFRICPTNDDKDKNPDGFVVSSRCGVERDESAAKESTKYISLDPSTSNYVVGILHQLEKLKILDQVSVGLKNSLLKLFPQTKYLFPVMVKATTYETVKDSGYKETRYKPTDTDETHCMILEVYAESALITQIFDISENFEDFNDSKKGQWLTLKKSPRKNELVAYGKKSPLNEEERELVSHEKYPSLVKISKRDKMSHKEIVALVCSAHWKDKVESMGVDFKDYGDLASPFVPNREEQVESVTGLDDLDLDALSL